MASTLSAFPISRDYSYLLKALNDGKLPTGTRSPPFANPIVQITARLLATVPYWDPGPFYRSFVGGAGIATANDPGSTPTKGKLRLVLIAECRHNDPIARNIEFTRNITLGAVTTSVSVDGTLGLGNGNPAFLKTPFVMNENEAIGFTVPGLAAGQVVTLKYIQLDFFIGDDPYSP